MSPSRKPSPRTQFPARPEFSLGEFVREQRKRLGLSQEELARRSGAGLRLIRDLEQGRERRSRIDTVNRILEVFGYELAPTRMGDRTEGQDG